MASAGADALEVSNPPPASPEPAATATNAPETVVAPPDDGMSAANRHAAAVMRGFLVGTYILIWLLLLAYLAYRYWAWQQKRKSRRR